jgi:hypothetical protein
MDVGTTILVHSAKRSIVDEAGDGGQFLFVARRNATTMCGLQQWPLVIVVAVVAAVVEPELEPEHKQHD